MTITRTTLLDLPVITTGTESGVWGDITNNGLTQYLDIAIAGMTSLTSADFTAGALTIETTEGNASSTNITSTSAQYAGFRVSSLATNSTITVGNTGSAVGRSYRIINADSTYTLTFKATGQTGVTFQPGTSGLIAFNGTDYVLIGMVGPATATDNAVVRFDGTSGRVVQNSAVTIADTTGNITGGAYNKVTITAPASSATLTIADGKTLTANATLTLAGTDATTMTFPSTSASIARTDAGQTFTGDQVIAGNLTMNAQGDVRFADSDSSNWVAFQGAATIASNVTWTLPSADGTNGQFLSTNGGGVLSWATASGGGGGGGTSVTVTQITATASQTTFNVTYTVGQISVYLNGALLASADYTATNGTTVVLATGAAANDIFTAVAYNSATKIEAGDSKVEVTDTGSNGTITFTTDNSERMRVDSSGNILIGTTSNTAGARLNVQGGYAYFKETNGGDVYIRSAYGGNTDPAIQVASNDPLLFVTNNLERGRFASGGNLDLQFNIGLGAAPATTSGTGITFPATQSASTDANTLDDYEEGTFTPVVTYSGTNTPTYGTQSGRYTKVGRSVQIQIYLQWNENGSTGNITITSLPFTSAASPYGVASTLGAGLTSWPTNASVGGFVAPSDTKINMYVNDCVPTAFSATYTGASQELYLNVNYFV